MRKRIQRFLRACLVAAPERGAVEAMALDLAAWQRAHNAAYGAFCGDASPGSLQEIPALPVALFRALPLCCFPLEHARVLFHTSGTTTGSPGIHRLLDTDTYDLASRGWFRAWLPDTPAHAVSLLPSPRAAPRSSLSHMIALLYPQARWLAELAPTADPRLTWEVLARQREPVFVASTALSLASLLDAGGHCELPAGSVLMTTGGFKGRSLEVQPEALLREASARLGPGVRLLGEYGMTELCSQLWSHPWSAESGEAPGGRGPFYGPPWLVPVVVDPATGTPLPTGEQGQLRFVDLANDHSVLAIETMDLGTLLPDGGLQLHGRLPGAAARGCSLSVEEALHASRASH